jgi:hypothetical protein
MSLLDHLVHLIDYNSKKYDLFQLYWKKLYTWTVTVIFTDEVLKSNAE